MKYNSRITQITVLPVGDPIYSEKATVISIDDEAMGEFVTIKQQCDSGFEQAQRVSFDPDEWKDVKGAVEDMFKSISYYQDENQ